MAEKVAEVKMLAVYMKCDECKNGLMIHKDGLCWRGEVGFPHECNSCGHEEVYPRMYPYQRVILAEGLREPTEAEKRAGAICRRDYSLFLAKMVATQEGEK